MKKLLLLLALSFTIGASANLVVIKSLASDGAGSLKNACETGAAGDTIVINVSGTISLSTSIMMTGKNQMHIIGAYPAHTKITINSAQPIFDLNGCSDITIAKIGFESITNGSRAFNFDGNAGEMKISYCLFEGFDVGTGDGGAIHMNDTPLEIFSSSFVGNSAENGGAIMVLTGSLTSVNCSYIGNSVTSNGGAINYDDNYFNSGLLHNTFYENSSANSGDNVHAGGTTASGSIFLRLNASVALTGSTFGQFVEGGPGIFITEGGNVFFPEGPNDFTWMNPANGDNFSPGTEGLHSAGVDPYVTDGYGLKYFTIIDQNSSFVDLTVFAPVTLTSPPEDCRRAPRVLTGQGAFNPRPDAGAVEYTQLRVIYDTGDNTTPGELGWAVAQNFDFQNFIEFDLPDLSLPATIQPIIFMAENGNASIIDGYSQTGSVIPGPPLAGNLGVEGGNQAINIEFNGAGGYGIQFGGSSSGSRVSGINFLGFPSFGLDTDGCDGLKVQGCKFGLDNGNALAGNLNAGVRLAASSNCVIGGTEHWQRNVFSANGGTAESCGLFLSGGSNDNTVIGNIFGLNPDGITSLTASPPANSNGIFNNGSGNKIGTKGLLAGNLFGDLLGTAIIESGSISTSIQRNFIGTDYEGYDAKPCSTGVLLQSNAQTITIGSSTSPKLRNIISSNFLGDIIIVNAGNSGVYGNYIGLDSSGTSIVQSTFNTIEIDGANVFNIEFGMAGVLTSRNYIAGSQIGINVKNSSGNIGVFNNYIGTDVAGLNTFANQEVGVFLQAGAAPVNIGLPNGGNLIGGFTSGLGSGIRINSGSNNHFVQANIIGLDATGLATIPNGTGIGVLGDNNQIGGIYVNGDGNTVSGNNLYGVDVLGGANLTRVEGNRIGTGVLGNESGLGNGVSGVKVFDATNTTIGGIGPNGNVISGQSGATNTGILLDGTGSGTSVSANRIGTDFSGTAPIANGTGIKILNTHEAIIGLSVGHENYICANTKGIHSLSPNVTIDGNYIGVGVGNVTASMENQDGIVIEAIGNTIGGSAGFINIISNNSNTGIHVNGDGSDNTTIDNCSIGIDGVGASAPNLFAGIWIVGADFTDIGTTFGNTIQSNDLGVLIEGLAEGNQLSNNTIGDPGGTMALGNSVGVQLENGPFNNQIGPGNQGVGNLICGNSTVGIDMLNTGTGNSIQGNYIGITPTNIAAGNTKGIRITSSSDDVLVGGDNPNGIGTFNVISNNVEEGVLVEASTNINIQGNYIGTNVTANGPASNDVGIRITSASNGTNIGLASSPNKSNTISCNTQAGIILENSSNTNIQMNNIGTDFPGIGALNIQDVGIIVLSAANSVSIGGDYSTSANLIAGNVAAGIVLNDVSAVNIRGNSIGGFGSQDDGIFLTGTSCTGNFIGQNPHAQFGNEIYANEFNGIYLENGAHTNTIASNYIGFTRLNTLSANVQDVGVFVASTAGATNFIGHNSLGGGNFISGNTSGIVLDNVDDQLVYNNIIGLDINGALPYSNDDGVYILNGSQVNNIGGSGSFEQNVISGNGNGVHMENPSTQSNVVAGNVIGLRTDLGGVVPNSVGVLISSGAQTNQIGESSAGGGNLIDGNNIGIEITDAGTDFNVVVNNTIGGNFGNTYGALMLDGAQNNIIGGSLANRNVISGNDSVGVGISLSSNNFVEGNLIGLQSDGLTPNGNLIGVYLDFATTNQIGNAGTGKRNIISGNDLHGMVLDAGSDGNIIYNNFIGTDETGNASGTGVGNTNGILMYGASGNYIGNDWNADEGNVICSNDEWGVFMDSCSNNFIYGNNVGLSKNNDFYLGNGFDGLFLHNSSNLNSIGNSTNGLENVITANGNAGIRIKGSDSNSIKANFIGNDDVGGGGTAPSGVNDQVTGVAIDTASVSNVIDDINVISGNSSFGVAIFGPGTEFNTVEGNRIGVDITGNSSFPNATANVIITDGAQNNTIGGTDPNIIGGNVPDHVVITGLATDSNVVLNNSINIAVNNSTFTSNNGIHILDNAKNNIIGGGGSNDGNYIGGLSADGIRLEGGANETIIIGNTIGLNPVGGDSDIGGSGIHIQGSNSTWIGTETVGSDSANVITNCLTGINVPFLSTLGSFKGNSIYDNDQQGIDLFGDGMVTLNDTNNANILLPNYGIDQPEILSAWNCADGNTHVGFMFYASNALPNYSVQFYRNPTPDVSTYGEGEIFLGNYFFSPETNIDTIEIDLGLTLAANDVITATITGVWGNTSEFSQQFSVTAPPTFPAPTTIDETCFGSDDGVINISAPGAYYFTSNVPTDTTYGINGDTITRPAGTYLVDAIYLNGCARTQTVVLNPGPDLPFNYTVIPDTCGNGFGSIVIDTVITNSSGGSGNYGYTFSDGPYLTSIDTLAITAGTFNVQIEDQTLGCYSLLVPITVDDITDIIDESFDFDNFCPGASAFPYNIIEAGGSWEIDNGGVIDIASGEITTSVPGTTYEVIHTVGFCDEKDTIFVTAEMLDDNSVDYPDFCFGSTPSITVGTPGGTWSSTTSGAIDASTGEIILGPGLYDITYLTNGACPTDSNLTVEVLASPAAPPIIVVDSIYCPNDVIASLNVTGVTGESYAWYDDPSLTTSLSATISFTPSTLNPGDNYFYVVSTALNGCVSEPDSANYLLSDLSGLGVGDDFATCLTSEIELNAYGGETYSWSSSTQITGDLTDSLTSAVISTPEDFYVEIIDVNGCVYRDTISITLLPSDSCFVETYNAFSPNNDGMNDFWFIDGIEGFPENEVYIYNRWGDAMIKFVNYNNSDVIWDGTRTNGKKVPAGTYFYVVNVGGSQDQAGWVQIVE